MAFGNDEQLNIIIRARDYASKTLSSVHKRLKTMEPTFQRMSVVGTAAFAGIAAATNVAVKEAAVAEGAYNKFNTVFGEHSGDMLKFVEDIRQRMPSATHEIVRMSSDLQDLLVPMGIARKDAADMTKGFVTLANQLAAFNDVDPTQVLEAFKSGLAGSSEPLRRFGINALESSLELEALNSGILEAGKKFTDLDAITRSQVRAQALLSIAVKQSSDAINGFEANNDSLLRRSQALRATWQEMKVTLGTALIPVIDQAVKTIAPIIEKIAAWIEKNPELARNIIITTAALAGLVTVLGAVGLFMAAISAPAIVATAALAALSVIVYTLISYWDNFKEGAITAFNNIGETILAWTTVIQNKLQGWGLQFQLLGHDIQTFWDNTTNVFKSGANFLIGIAESFANSWIKAINSIIEGFNKIKFSFPSWVPGLGGKSFAINIATVPEVSLPRFEHGGIVPGPAGSAVPIIAHGQEQIVPASSSRRRGGDTIVFNLNNVSFRDRDDIGYFKRSMEDTYRSVVRNNKLQTL